MAVKELTDLLTNLNQLIPEELHAGDEYISLIEDISDTLAASTIAADTENWKAKYEENDASWRKRYTERFLNVGDHGKQLEEQFKEQTEDEVVEEKTTYDDLFNIKRED